MPCPPWRRGTTGGLNAKKQSYFKCHKNTWESAIDFKYLFTFNYQIFYVQ